MDLSRHHSGTVGYLRDLLCLFTSLGTVLQLAELMGGMTNDGTGMVMVGQAVGSRAMSTRMFRAMEPLKIGDETRVTITDVTTGENTHAGEVEALPTKMWAGAESWNY